VHASHRSVPSRRPFTNQALAAHPQGASGPPRPRARAPAKPEEGSRRIVSMRTSMTKRLLALDLRRGLGRRPDRAADDPPARRRPSSSPGTSLRRARPLRRRSRPRRAVHVGGLLELPARRYVLAGLERTQPVAGARIVPLGLHVDTWDRLGWTDPFSMPRATERQRKYASAPWRAAARTRQAVIDGRAETVGSRRAAIELAIAEAAKRPHVAIAVDLAARADEASRSRSLFASARCRRARRATPMPSSRSRRASACRRAARRERRLDPGAHRDRARSRGGRSGGGRGRLSEGHAHAAARATAKDLHIVAFVQERASRRVLGTATRDAR